MLKYVYCLLFEAQLYLRSTEVLPKDYRGITEPFCKSVLLCLIIPFYWPFSPVTPSLPTWEG